MRPVSSSSSSDDEAESRNGNLQRFDATLKKIANQISSKSKDIRYFLRTAGRVPDWEAHLEYVGKVLDELFELQEKWLGRDEGLLTLSGVRAMRRPDYAPDQKIRRELFLKLCNLRKVTEQQLKDRKASLLGKAQQLERDIAAKKLIEDAGRQLRTKVAQPPGMKLQDAMDALLGQNPGIQAHLQAFLQMTQPPNT